MPNEGNNLDAVPESRLLDPGFRVSEQAAIEREANSIADPDRDERIAGRAQEKEDLKNDHLEKVRNIIEHPEDFSAEDRRRRLREYYGDAGLKRGVDTLPGYQREKSWLDIFAKTGKKAVAQGITSTGILVVIGGVTAGSATALLTGPALAGLGLAVAGGALGRGLYETFRKISGKESKERNIIEKANQAIAKRIGELSDEAGIMLTRLRLDNPTAPATELEKSPEYLKLVGEIIDLMYDDSSRRVRLVMTPEGEKFEAFGKDEQVEEGEKTINVREAELALRERSKNAERASDIIAMISSFGSVAAVHALAGGTLGHFFAQRATDQAGAALARGETVGPYDFDGDRIRHAVKALAEGITPHMDRLNDVWQDTIKNMMPAIFKNELASAGLEMTKGAIAAAAGSLVNFFSSGIWREGKIPAEENIKNNTSNTINATKRLFGIEGQQINPSINIDLAPQAEAKENEQVGPIKIGTQIRISRDPGYRKRIGLHESLDSHEFFIVAHYDGEMATLIPLKDNGRKDTRRGYPKILKRDLDWSKIETRRNIIEMGRWQEPTEADRGIDDEIVVPPGKFDDSEFLEQEESEVGEAVISPEEIESSFQPGAVWRPGRNKSARLNGGNEYKPIPKDLKSIKIISALTKSDPDKVVIEYQLEEETRQQTLEIYDFIDAFTPQNIIDQTVSDEEAKQYKGAYLDWVEDKLQELGVKLDEKSDPRYWKTLNGRNLATATLANVEKYEDLNTDVVGEGQEKEIDKLFKNETLKRWIDKFTVHRNRGDGKIYYDLDVKAVLLVLMKAGFDKNQILVTLKDHSVQAGAYERGRLNIDTGNRDGINSDFGEQTDRMGNKKFNYDNTVYVDHHAPDSARDSSAAKNMYEAMLDLHLVERDPVLEKVLTFVTYVDNKNYPDQERYFDYYDRTILGLATYMQEDQLYAFFADGNKETDILTDDELKKYRLISSYQFKKDSSEFKPMPGKSLSMARDGRTFLVLNRQKEQRFIVDQAKNIVEQLGTDGFTVETEKYGKVMINPGIAFPLGIDAAYAKGYDTYLSWSKDNYFISTKRSDFFENGFSIPNGKVIRRSMFIGKVEDTSLGDVLNALAGKDVALSGKLKTYAETGQYENPIAKPAVTEQQIEEESSEIESTTEAEAALSDEEIAKKFEAGTVWVPIKGVSVWMKKEGEAHGGLDYIPSEIDSIKIKSTFDPKNPLIKVEYNFGGETRTRLIESMSFIRAFTPEEDVSQSPQELAESKESYFNWVKKEVGKVGNSSEGTVVELKNEEEEEPREGWSDKKIEEAFEPGKVWIATGRKSYFWPDNIGRGEQEEFDPKELDIQSVRIVNEFGGRVISNARILVKYLDKTTGGEKEITFGPSDFLEAFKPEEVDQNTDQEERDKIDASFERWVSEKLDQLRRATAKYPARDAARQAIVDAAEKEFKDIDLNPKPPVIPSADTNPKFPEESPKQREPEKKEKTPVRRAEEKVEVQPTDNKDIDQLIKTIGFDGFDKTNKDHIAGIKLFAESLKRNQKEKTDESIDQIVTTTNMLESLGISVRNNVEENELHIFELERLVNLLEQNNGSEEERPETLSFESLKGTHYDIERDQKWKFSKIDGAGKMHERTMTIEDFVVKDDKISIKYNRTKKWTEPMSPNELGDEFDVKSARLIK